MSSNKNNKKRKRERPRPTIHPNNRYSDNPPDFSLLASLYPSFEPYVLYCNGCPRIDWTDFSATRELTRVLLLHDHGVNWWIPDGQLCPTVPNRSNYIHWIEDLLSSDIISKINTGRDNVRGFDIGTGANCIYPLLGASLKGWSFVGSDVTDVALEWAEKNVQSNPHISNLIEIRKVENGEKMPSVEGPHKCIADQGENITDLNCCTDGAAEYLPPSYFELVSAEDKIYSGEPLLLGVVRDGEKFDFCMCNPPFFESMEESGLNPKTSCGGTPAEMVCPGGEKAFIARIIEDSVVLKQAFRWYTTMVGKKMNLKFLTSKLREVGVTIVKTTEFVQGQTCRWGLAWSFMPPVRKITFHAAAERNNLSFMLEGLQRQLGAANILQSVDYFFSTNGASCKLNVSSFTVDVTASKDQCNLILKNEEQHCDEAASCVSQHETLNNSSCSQSPFTLSFRVTVFQQIPGTLLIKGSLQHRNSPGTGLFSAVFQRLEEFLKHKFSREKAT